MSWSHFTTLLDGSRVITTAERDELYDKFQALFAGGCGGGDYELNSSDMAEITGSPLLTDLASLDAPGPVNTLDRLHAVIAAASGAFSNYSSAVTAALTAAGITSTERDALIDSGLDSWQLWNYYRELIDGLECVFCSIFETDAGTSGAFEHTFDVTGQFPIDADVVLYANFAADGTGADLELLANGSVVFSTGCVTEHDAETTISIPAGTTEIKLRFTLCSGASSVEWGYILQCA